MDLTNRRKQFLEQIMNLYEKTGLPVHYITLADLVGVSKWTAYDMLKELEKNGWLMRDYSINPHETGRSMVVFTPTLKTEELFGRIKAAVSEPDQIKEIKNSVLSLLQQVRTFSPGRAMEPFFEKISQVSTQIEFCLFFLGILILYLNILDKPQKHMIESLIGASERPEIQLSLFVGTVMGTGVQSVGHELGVEIPKFIALFFGYLDNLSPDEMNTLMDFVREALAAGRV